jgi:hypothetical protein
LHTEFNIYINTIIKQNSAGNEKSYKVMGTSMSAAYDKAKPDILQIIYEA